MEWAFDIASEVFRAYFGPLDSTGGPVDQYAASFEIPLTDMFEPFFERRWGSIDNTARALIDGADALDDIASLLTFLLDAEGYPSDTPYSSLFTTERT